MFIVPLDDGGRETFIDYVIPALDTRETFTLWILLDIKVDSERERERNLS